MPIFNGCVPVEQTGYEITAVIKWQNQRLIQQVSMASLRICLQNGTPPALLVNKWEGLYDKLAEILAHTIADHVAQGSRAPKTVQRHLIYIEDNARKHFPSSVSLSTKLIFFHSK